MRLKNKVSIITGAASGIGKESVLKFLDEGSKVVAADLNTEALNNLKNEINHSDEVFEIFECDVSSEEAIKDLVGFAIKKFNKLDVIFNNAGIGGAFGPITEINLNDWQRTTSILLDSVFLGIKYAAKEMQRNSSGGSIINTSSIAGMAAGSGPQAYSAAKAAVINLTQTTAHELGENNIRVNSISPGVISTPLLQTVLGDDRDSNKALLDQPLEAKGMPIDIANTALFLASDESKFITGINICVDGGLTLDRSGLMKQAAEEYDKLDMGPVTGLNMGSTGQESTIEPIDDKE